MSAIAGLADWVTVGLVWVVARVVFILLTAAAATWLLRGGSAATRHRIWTTAVVVSLVLPLMSLVVPRLEFGAPWLSSPASPAGYVFAAEPVVVVAPAVAPKLVVVPRPDVSEGVSHAPRGSGRAAGAPVPTPFEGTPAVVAIQPDAVSGPFALLPSVWLVLFGIWAVVAAGLLMRVAVTTAQARLSAGRLRDVTDSALGTAVLRVARQRGIGRLRVLLGAADAMPATWGIAHPVLMLPAGALSWTAARLDTVARHELAHIGRGDVVAQLLADILCALHWFNPLAWVAANRMRVERELACDDEVLAAGARPSDYATELVSLARGLRELRVPATAVAMARRSGLHARVEAVLDEGRRRGSSRVVLRRIRFAGIALLILMAALTPRATAAAPETLVPPVPEHARSVFDLPGPIDLAWRWSQAFLDRLNITFHLGKIDIPAPPRGVGIGVGPVADAVVVPDTNTPDIASAPVAEPVRSAVQTGTLCWTNTERGSTSVSRNDRGFVLDFNRGSCSVDVRVRGELRFNADFSRITSLSSGGRAEFEESDGRRSRRVELRDDDGALRQRWVVDGRERPFDGQAQAWLDAMLLNTFRSGGLAAEERATALLRTGGVDALLAEMQLLHGDWARGLYYRLVLSDGGLDDARTATLLRQMTTEIRSDHTRQQILETVAERRALTDARVRAAYIAAAASIESDHSRSRALDAALRQRLSGSDLAAILDAAAGIGSDHNKTELLVQMAERHALSPELRTAYLAVARTIDSDHSAGMAAHALLERGSPSQDEIALALGIAAGIDSDHTRAELLARLAGHADLTDAGQRRRFEDALAGIRSDHSMGTVLMAVMEHGVEEVRAGVVLRAARSINSDHTRGQVLIRLAEAGGVTNATRAAFEEAVAGISSSHTRQRVEQTLREARR